LSRKSSAGAAVETFDIGGQYQVRIFRAGPFTIDNCSHLSGADIVRVTVGLLHADFLNYNRARRLAPSRFT